MESEAVSHGSYGESENVCDRRSHDYPRATKCPVSMAYSLKYLFLYDTSVSVNRLKADTEDEAGDPLDSILFYFPKNASSDSQVQLCGQLMGVILSMESMFSPVTKLVLEKEVTLVWNVGDHYLVIGCDTKLHPCGQELLRELLIDAFLFFCGTMAKISSRLRRGMDEGSRDVHRLGPRGEHGVKLMSYSEVMDSFVPVCCSILQRSLESPFLGISLLSVPKTASECFMEAQELLQACEELPCVLGGAFFIARLLITSTLGKHITKMISIADVPRMHSEVSAKTILTSVWLPVVEYKKLLEKRQQPHPDPQWTHSSSSSCSSCDNLLIETSHDCVTQPFPIPSAASQDAPPIKRCRSVPNVSDSGRPSKETDGTHCENGAVRAWLVIHCSGEMLSAFIIHFRLSVSPLNRKHKWELQPPWKTVDDLVSLLKKRVHIIEGTLWFHLKLHGQANFPTSSHYGWLKLDRQWDGIVQEGSKTTVDHQSISDIQSTLACHPVKQIAIRAGQDRLIYCKRRENDELYYWTKTSTSQVFPSPNAIPTEAIFPEKASAHLQRLLRN
ncbi:unnamed protein product [Darwinula stevensoni]|uniref:CCZ1/INTU/HSP4 first Longin domain-containing protein n=1 Tax=Darwinula stevensoni TaxID=69355 RepID=A0A7R8XEG4_9CRUS|nr:unnamed protein product [Darwinula stevensoni]CAG0894218.1 unnamed protein product [Darwinula stevensoni]